MAPPMTDLMAIATVRRLLLECGIEPSLDGSLLAGGPGRDVQLWLVTPHDALEGQPPLAVLQGDHGEARIRELLKNGGAHSTPNPSTPSDGTSNKHR